MVTNLEGARVLSITGVVVGGEEVVITTDRGTLRLWHDRDCCEQVRIEEVHGDPSDLVGHVVSRAEKATDGSQLLRGEEASLWTFYRFATDGGDLTLRWLGESNGYYSVEVDAEWSEVSDG